MAITLDYLAMPLLKLNLVDAIATSGLERIASRPESAGKNQGLNPLYVITAPNAHFPNKPGSQTGNLPLPSYTGAGSAKYACPVLPQALYACLAFMPVGYAIPPQLPFQGGYKPIAGVHDNAVSGANLAVASQLEASQYRTNPQGSTRPTSVQDTLLYQGNLYKTPAFSRN